MKVLVISEKGGAGKSFVSANVIAPAMYINTKEKVKLTELDTANFTANYLIDSKILTANSIDLSEITELDDVIVNVLENDVDIIDVGSNSVQSVLKKLLDGYIHLFDFVFIPFLPNPNELELANRMFSIITGAGFEKEKVYYIANKYNETSEELCDSALVDRGHILRVYNIDIHNKAMQNAVSLYDIYQKIDIAKNREEIIKKGKEKDIQAVRKLVELNTMKAKLIEFYDMNEDFKKLVSMLGGIK